MNDHNPGIYPALWSRLLGRVWHVTKLFDLGSILADGAIKPRMGTYEGGFCRRQNGVSVFDFRVAPRDVGASHHNWGRWLNIEAKARIAVWLRIDHDGRQESLITPPDTWTAFEASHEKGKLIRGVEGCHQGELPTSAVLGAIGIDSHDTSCFIELNGRQHLLDQLSAFADSLPPHEPCRVIYDTPPDLGEALERARARVERMRRSSDE